MGCRPLSRYIFTTGLIWSGLVTAANNYPELLDRAVNTCTAIAPREYQTGLILNPDGYRSYYRRSACFQAAAVRFRDAGLCARVKQRRALFSSSWGYSRGNCLKLVSEGIESDRQIIAEQREQYSNAHIQLDTFVIELNGNGRDFDIIPAFSGDAAHAYTLRFELIPGQADNAPILLHESGFYLQGRSSRIRIYLRADELSKRFPAFVRGQTYPVRATLTFTLGTGTQAGYWSNTFIESQFPLRHRTQALTREVQF